MWWVQQTTNISEDFNNNDLQLHIYFIIHNKIMLLSGTNKV